MALRLLRTDEVWLSVRLYGVIWVLILFGVVINGISVFAAVDYGRAIYRAHITSRTWNVTGSEIVESSAIRGCGRGSSYYLGVKYKYRVDGKSYTNDRVSFGNGYCSGKSGAESMAANYALGSFTYVYYDPLNPSESVLTKGGTENGTYFLFVLFLLTPLGTGYWLWRTIKFTHNQ